LRGYFAPGVFRIVAPGMKGWHLVDANPCRQALFGSAAARRARCSGRTPALPPAFAGAGSIPYDDIFRACRGPKSDELSGGHGTVQQESSGELPCNLMMASSDCKASSEAGPLPGRTATSAENRAEKNERRRKNGDNTNPNTGTCVFATRPFFRLFSFLSAHMI
jgi:hypothetical protein